MAKIITKETSSVIDHTAASAISSGDVVVDNSRVLVAVADIASGAVGACFARNVEAEITKASGEAWSEGDPIYYDGSEFTTAAAGGTYAGVASRDAASSATTGYVDLGAVAPVPTVQSLTPDDSEGTGNTILETTKSATVGAVTNDANDFIVLPAIANVPVGHEILIDCAAGGAFEMRTPASSGTTINGVNSDGTQEYLCTDTELVRVIKHADGWVATALTALGAVATAVVPD